MLHTNTLNQIYHVGEPKFNNATVSLVTIIGIETTGTETVQCFATKRSKTITIRYATYTEFINQNVGNSNKTYLFLTQPGIFAKVIFSFKIMKC